MNTRRYALGAVSLLAVMALGGAGPAVAGSDGGTTVRFDIAKVVPGAVVVGGTTISTATAPAGFVGDTLALTATGTAEPAEVEAAGGGTFVHKASNGSVRTSGFYRVTRFISWQLTSGSFAATGLADAIGNAAEGEPHAGVLTVGITFYAGGKAVGTGRMVITCALPGAPAGLEEGVTVIAHPAGTNIFVRFTEKTAAGPTLFHVLH